VYRTGSSCYFRRPQNSTIVANAPPSVSPWGRDAVLSEARLEAFRASNDLPQGW
jgi:hypothetical protein